VDGPVDLDKVYSALLKAGVLRAEIATD
jgi:hypothetical protein